MLNKVLTDKVYCGLDIGAQKLKVGLIQVKDSKVEVIGTYEHPIYGFKDSSVSDLNEFAECINHVLNELTEKTGIRTKEIHIGIDGSLVDIRRSSTAIPLVDRGNKIIAASDVKRLNKQARLLGIKLEEEVLHEMPQFYQVDDISTATNPLGLYGRKLAVQSLMIVSNVDRIKNILKSVNHAGYDVSNLFFGTYVSSNLALTLDQKKNGCILIDFGANITSILIFDEGVLKFVDTIKIGGNDFTRAIATQLNLSLELAEEIKKSYATAIKSQIQEDEEILVKRESSYMPINRIEIYNAIEEQLKLAINGIYDSIMSSQLYGNINEGIKMIGGGALLPGLIECIEKKTNLTVSLAQLNQMNQKNVSNAALYSTAISLAQKGFEDSIAYSISKNNHTTWSKRVANKVKDLYMEYF